MRTIRAIAATALAVSLVSLASCSSAGNTAALAGAPDADLSQSKLVKASGEEYWQHTASADDIAALASKEPLTGKWAVLYVNGLGCPLCATNIDKQLERLRGVEAIRVDLGSGTATLALSENPQSRPPSPMLINKAVTDAGFTLVKIASK